jgi:hypothetical protein
VILLLEIGVEKSPISEELPWLDATVEAAVERARGRREAT